MRDLSICEINQISGAGHYSAHDVASIAGVSSAIATITIFCAARDPWSWKDLLYGVTISSMSTALVALGISAVAETYQYFEKA